MAASSQNVGFEEDMGMEARIAAFDWASTPLGPREAWPHELKNAVDIGTHCSLPTAIFWGPDHRMIYNDGWRRLLDPDVNGLGTPAADSGGSLWPVLAEPLQQVRATACGAFVREQSIQLRRGRTMEESFWNCSIVPILDVDGGIVGFFNQANEVTRAVHAERRLSFLIKLADRLRGLLDPGLIKSAAIELLGGYLNAGRVGYAELNADETVVTVRRDWTSDPLIPALAGQSAPLETFGAGAAEFLRSGEPLAIDDVRGFPEFSVRHAEGWAEIGTRAMVVVPLVRDGALKALLYVHDPEPRAWRRAEVAMVRDVAERTWDALQRAQAEQSLRDSEDHYRHAVELNPQVSWTALPDGQLNRVARRWHDWTGTTGLGDSWTEGLHPDDGARTFERWGQCVATGETYDIEHRVKHLDGSFRWARSRAFPRRDEEGRICLWYGATEDIHERKVAEERQRLLINELNHRVKNTLATVQAIAFQTLKGDVPLAEARARFEARLMALSRAHNLLTEENWEGTSLDRVIADATAYLAGEHQRFSVSGERLWLAPRAALAIALALHELGTNAAKYGALSTDRGTVSIGWTIQDRMLRIEWKEKGGPAVAAPARRGFGSRLIERGLESDLAGKAELVFEPDGLLCRIEAALDTIQAREGGLG